MRQIKLTRVGFRANVKIASRVVSYRIVEDLQYSSEESDSRPFLRQSDSAILKVESLFMHFLFQRQVHHLSAYLILEERVRCPGGMSHDGQ